MKFFRKLIQVLNFTVTLGGSEVLKVARNNYNESYLIYQQLYECLTSTIVERDSTLKRIGECIAQVEPSLLLSQKILKREHAILSKVISHTNTLKKLDEFSSSYNTALSAGFGGVLGGASAAGAWVVVGLIGSASTGAAISGLSGVAAYNATLAWFGGGALAAGGAGMSGGMMVLGGIVAAPMVIFATKTSYSKAKQIDQKNSEMRAETTSVKKQIPEAEEQLRLAEKCYSVIEHLNSEYINRVQYLTRVLYPWGMLSKFKQTIFQVFSMPHLTSDQESALLELQEITDQFLKNFSTLNDHVAETRGPKLLATPPSL